MLALDVEAELVWTGVVFVEVLADAGWKLLAELLSPLGVLAASGFGVGLLVGVVAVEAEVAAGCFLGASSLSCGFWLTLDE